MTRPAVRAPECFTCGRRAQPRELVLCAPSPAGNGELVRCSDCTDLAERDAAICRVQLEDRYCDRCARPMRVPAGSRRRRCCPRCQP